MQSKALINTPVALVVLLVFSILFSGFAYAQPHRDESKIIEVIPADDGKTDEIPRSAVFNGALYLLWESPASKSMPDTDIACKVLQDGKWSDITYLTSGIGTERDLSLCVTETRLYAAWITDSTDYSHGSDWDVMLSWCGTDGKWSGPIEVSPADDSTEDHTPSLTYYAGLLYIVWSGVDDNGSSIELRTWDGSSFSNVVPVTQDAYNNNPQAVVYRGDIWIVWSSNSSTTTTGPDFDIVAVDYTANPSNTYELTPSNDMEDDLYPSVAANESGIYVVWQTNDKTTTAGSDDDILMTYYSDRWEFPFELTSKHDSGSDTYPTVYLANGKTYVFWESDDPTTTSGEDWDIVYTTVEKTKSGPITEVTPAKDGYDDGSFYSAGYSSVTYDGQMFVFWETANPGITDGTDKDIVYRTVDTPTTVDKDGGSGTDGSGTDGMDTTDGNDTKDTTNVADNNVLIYTAVVLGVIAVLLIGIYIWVRAKNAE